MEQVVAFLDHLTYWHWFALGAVLLILEIFTPTFYLIWPGIAAVVVGALKVLEPGLSWQISITVFGVMSLVAIVVWSMFYKRLPANGVEVTALNRRATTYIGRRAVVAESFRAGRGPILLDDTRWQAVNEVGTDLGAGSAVTVTGADGVTLKVRPAG